MLPTVPFWCAKCGYRTDVEDRLVGKKVRCPKCETRQVLRVRSANTVLKAGEQPVKAGAAVAEESDTVFGPDLTAAGAAAPPPRTDGGTDTFAERTLSASEATAPSMDTPPTLMRPGDPPARKTTRTIRPRTAILDPPSAGPGDLTLPDRTRAPAELRAPALDSLSIAGTSLATIRPSTTIYARSAGETPTGYALGDLIGRGGMGAVHLARQQSLGRQVAVKTLGEGGTDPSTAARFRAEAAVMAALEHPNIIPVHDLVQDASGELRLVMKHIQGATWRDLLYPAAEEHVRQAVAMRFDDHLEILLKTCDAMAFAHDRGILHLDLKPANIMVGAFGEVLVLDWGCALAARGDHPLIPKASEFTGISGTPAYMAPEMATQSGRIGTFTDIYLLGAILYEIMAGRPPHRADTVQASLLLAQANELPAPRPRAGRPCPEELVALVQAAMATDPAARPASVAAFASRLRTYRQHVEANALADQARARLAAAEAGSANADDDFRQALASCEQALAQWAETPGMTSLRGRILLAHAQHSLATGAFRVAQSQAERARDLGSTLNDRTLRDTAQRVLEHARADESAHRHRIRTTRLLLVALITVLGGGIIGVAAMLGTLASARSGMNQEKVAAASSEEQLQGALARSSQERAAIVPLLVERARRELAGGAVDQALADLAQARASSPSDAHVALLEGAILAAHHHWADALTALHHAVPESPEIHALTAVAEQGASGWTPQVESALTQVLLADDLLPLVDQHHAAPEELLAYERRVIDGLWSGASQYLRQVEGGLAFEPPATAEGVTHLHDLSALAGLPLVRLALDGARVEDLAPLAHMPLTHLSLAHTLVHDLTPLAQLRLQVLRLDDTYVTDLRPLAHQPLVELSLAGTPATDLTPLAGLPLATLDASRTHAALASLLGPSGGGPASLRRLALNGMPDVDAAAVDALPLTQLSVRGSGLTALAPLHDLRLRQLDAGQTAITDLHPLAHMPLEDVRLDGCHQLTSLVGLPVAHLTTLTLNDSGITDCSPLAGAPLVRLGFTPDAITGGWEQLHALAGLREIDAGRGSEAASAFWQRYDRR